MTSLVDLERHAFLHEPRRLDRDVILSRPEIRNNVVSERIGLCAAHLIRCGFAMATLSPQIALADGSTTVPRIELVKLACPKPVDAPHSATVRSNGNLRGKHVSIIELPRILSTPTYGSGIIERYSGCDPP
jgi:hypothetical protein